MSIEYFHQLRTPCFIFDIVHQAPREYPSSFVLYKDFLGLFDIFHDEIKYINTNYDAKRLIINITLVIKKHDIEY